MYTESFNIWLLLLFLSGFVLVRSPFFGSLFLMFPCRFKSFFGRIFNSRTLWGSLGFLSWCIVYVVCCTRVQIAFFIQPKKNNTNEISIVSSMHWNEIKMHKCIQMKGMKETWWTETDGCKQWNREREKRRFRKSNLIDQRQKFVISFARFFLVLIMFVVFGFGFNGTQMKRRRRRRKRNGQIAFAAVQCTLYANTTFYTTRNKTYTQLSLSLSLDLLSKFR